MTNQMPIDPDASVVLVGNGPSLLGRSYGPEIDQFQHIVRFNDFQTAGFEKFVGKKTTLWAVCTRPAPPDPPSIPVLHMSQRAKPFGAQKEYFIPTWFRAEIEHQLRDRATWSGINTAGLIISSGLLTAAYFIHLLGIRQIYVIGMDSFSKKTTANHHYWNPTPYAKPREHAPEIEADMFFELERSGRLKFLNRGDQRAPIPRRPLFQPTNWKTQPIFTAEKIYPIATLPRSGSHLLADWIGSQLTGDVRFSSGLNVMPHRANDPQSFAPRSARRLPTTKPQPGPVSCIATLEWYDPASQIDIPWLDAPQRHPIILLRNPFNWIASIAAHGTNVFRNNGPERLIQFWKAYARQFLHPNHHPALTPIFYDQFIADPQYRNHISEKIHITRRSDAALTRVNNYGGGSSFDKTDFDSAASQMKTNHRWKIFAAEPWMIRLKNDAELQLLTQKITAACK